MNTTNTTSRQPLTVGPSTENLLLALQSIEDARSYYFAAFEAVGGEQYAGDMSDKAAAPFDALRALIEGELTDNIRTWASAGAPDKVL